MYFKSEHITEELQDEKIWELSLTYERSKLFSYLPCDRVTNILKTKLLLIETCEKIIENDYKKLSTKMRYSFAIRNFSQFIQNKFKRDDIQISSLTPDLFENFASFRKNQVLNAANSMHFKLDKNWRR